MKKKVVKKSVDKGKTNACRYGGNGCGGAVYGLGFIGSAVYYITTATSFWIGFLGILKSIVWPAFLIFEVMKYLGM